MSFILDALKKAESRRGHSPAVMTETPLGDIAPAQVSNRRVPLTAVTVAGGVLVIAALAWWLGRQSSPSATMADTAVSPVVIPMPAGQGNREVRPLDREAERRSAQSATRPATVADNVAQPARVVRASPQRTGSVEVMPSLPQAASPAPSSENLPSYEEIVLSGRAQLPALHLDIHVYADAPERRFVFVNNRKYRQGEQLDEGGSVERITPQGAVLNIRGHRFELTPD